MQYLIIFCAEYLIFIAATYAVYHVVSKHERRHHLRHIVIILGGAILAYYVSVFLKDLIAHPRPDLANPFVPFGDPYSFPSGHTAFTFTLAFAMASFDKRSAKILFALAVLVGASRVLLGVHFWYDIVGGVIVAYFVAKSVVCLAKNFIKKV